MILVKKGTITTLKITDDKHVVGYEMILVKKGTIIKSQFVISGGVVMSVVVTIKIPLRVCSLVLTIVALVQSRFLGKRGIMNDMIAQRCFLDWRCANVG